MRRRRLALIPARGGSKRLPRKNLLDFGGKPMVAWTIEAAKFSGVFDKVIVSTDDEELAHIGTTFGAEILRRSADLADDHTGLISVLQHVVRMLDSQFDSVCLLLPNCPMRIEADIRKSCEEYERRRPAALLSVVDYLWTPPYRALQQTENALTPVFGDWVNRKSQEYPIMVCPSGAIYWTDIQAVLKADALYVDGIEYFSMPWYRGIDIDTKDDFEIAAALRHAIDHGFEFSNTNA